MLVTKPTSPSTNTAQSSLASSQENGGLDSLTAGGGGQVTRDGRIQECFQQLATQFLPKKAPYELKDLSNLVLTDLAGECFLGSNLSGARLVGNFRGADLRCARLDGADLQEADLAGAMFAQPLRRSVLDLAYFPSGPIVAELHGPNFQKLDLRNFSRIVCSTSGALFRGSNLDGVDLSECCLRGADLQRIDLRHTRLPNDLKGANLSGADLRGKDLSGADLTGANLAGAKLEYATLPNQLLGVNLSGTDLTQVVLSHRDLTGSDLSDCDLRGLDLTDCILQAVTFRGCRLNDSSLEREYTPDDCRGHVKFPSNLNEADFSGTNLSGVDLSGSSLTGASFKGATIDATTRLPLNLPEVDFTSTTFKGFDLAEHDCSTAIFSSAKFIECKPPASIPDSLQLRSGDGSETLIRSATTSPQSHQNGSPGETTQHDSVEGILITQSASCAAINAIVQDPAVTYSFFLPRNSTPPHAHQIHAKRVDNDTIVLLSGWGKIPLSAVFHRLQATFY